MALPLWALTAGDINEVAGWANILALPISAMGVVLVVAEGARAGSGGFGRGSADVSSGSRSLATRPPAPARPNPQQLPPDVTHFTGRSADLAELDAMLALTTAGQGAALVISAVSGAAGVGKTALAIHWAHRVGDHFPDGALYVNLRGYGDVPVSPEQAINGFLRALGVTSEIIPWELETPGCR